ncbi:hypothetical protein FISHEDRAFT_76671 [Fistulina hepatica ATCC 64428]|uniref:Uncharacterized protein n=1 Tax=Fistulina hepatica ATCC 64428 TaxID=1128425 RepID=A0A0D7A395_9AGAR|nr:hypothetical protein FISHEDRAFT_76671 [Fistulina hepatica ATCC 64428]
MSNILDRPPLINFTPAQRRLAKDAIRPRAISIDILYSKYRALQQKPRPSLSSKPDELIDWCKACSRVFDAHCHVRHLPEGTSELPDFQPLWDWTCLTLDRISHVDVEILEWVPNEWKANLRVMKLRRERCREAIELNANSATLIHSQLGALFREMGGWDDQSTPSTPNLKKSASNRIHTPAVTPGCINKQRDRNAGNTADQMTVLPSCKPGARPTVNLTQLVRKTLAGRFGAWKTPCDYCRDRGYICVANKGTGTIPCFDCDHRGLGDTCNATKLVKTKKKAIANKRYQCHSTASTEPESEEDIDGTANTSSKHVVQSASALMSNKRPASSIHSAEPISKKARTFQKFKLTNPSAIERETSIDTSICVTGPSYPGQSLSALDTQPQGGISHNVHDKLKLWVAYYHALVQLDRSKHEASQHARVICDVLDKCPEFSEESIPGLDTAAVREHISGARCKLSARHS